MAMKNQLIINTEYFLSCAGSCAGCFLSEDERNSSNVNASQIIEPLYAEVKKAVAAGRGKEFFVVGFGRGNNLVLPDSEIERLGGYLQTLDKMIISDEIVYEVSTSLIGKIDSQIEKAKKLMSYSKNVYFNMVINSEITSKTFWKNIRTFHSALSDYRESLGFTDKMGDILVLNINPAFLPSIQDIDEFAKGIKSPLNISFFPLDETYIRVKPELFKNMQDWAIEASKVLKDYDLNVKNLLSQFKNQLKNLPDTMANMEKTRDIYLFIHKDGQITRGQPSSMGEVDYPRLIEKFKIDPDMKKAFMQMQKTTPCNFCKFQKECLVTGVYVNMLANSKKIKNSEHCLSGYQMFFEAFIPK